MASWRVVFQPEESEATGDEPRALSRVAAAAGVPLELPCGGLGQCGHCRVRLLEGAIAPTPDEEREIPPEHLARGYRLACRQTVDRDLVVYLGDNVRSRANQILIGGHVRQTVLEPGVDRLEVALGKAPLGDERDDWRRLEEAAGQAIEPTLPALRQLPGAIAAGNGTITIDRLGTTAVGIFPGPSPAPPVGFAVDIGTTTLVLYLLDLACGAELAHASMLNPQVQFGDDVIARIHYAGAHRQGLAELGREVRRALDQLLRQACEQAGVAVERVLRGTIVGNATMTHLFAGIDPAGLGTAPFAPVHQDGLTEAGAAFGLQAAPRASVTVLPNMAGFLGSDTVGVALAAMAGGEETVLAVDIGTNGEMVLRHEGRWYGCSAAAGPAFEGARISCGMRGAAGAIGTVELLDGALRLGVIDNVAPVGLCGSGLLDLLAVLLETGVLDPTGRFRPDAASPLAARLEGEGREQRFRLVDAADSGTGHALWLTAGDVREVQLAKGSIRASLEALLARAGVGLEQVARVALAGGFGSYLRVPSAIRCGLLPPFAPERVESVGNAAGAGARLALMSRAELALAEDLARRVEVLYLANDPVYQMQFMEQMVFPSA